MKAHVASPMEFTESIHDCCHFTVTWKGTLAQAVTSYRTNFTTWVALYYSRQVYVGRTVASMLAAQERVRGKSGLHGQTAR